MHEILDCNREGIVLRRCFYGEFNYTEYKLTKEMNEYQISTGSLLVGEDLNLHRIHRDEWFGWVPKSEVKFTEERIPFDPSSF